MLKIYPYSLISLLLSLLLTGFAQNLSQVQNLYTYPPNLPAREVAYSPDGSLLAVALWGRGKSHSIKILDANSGREVAFLIGHADRVNSVAFSPDGSFLASGSNDGTVKIWRIADFSLVASSFREHHNAVTSVAFSPTGDFLASGSWDYTVKIWRTNDFSLLTSLDQHTDPVESVAFSPAGDFLASGSRDNTVKIWRTNDFSLLTSLDQHTSDVFSVAFSPLGDFLASGSWDNTVKIWRTSDFSLLASLDEHDGWVNSVAFSPAGDFLASGSRDNTVKIWHVHDSYSLYGTIEGAKGDNDYWISSVAFHPAGTSLAVANMASVRNDEGDSESVVSLWGTASGKAVFCPSESCSVTLSNASTKFLARAATLPELTILFPTPNQKIADDVLTLQLELNDAIANYSVSASGTPLAISYPWRSPPNTEQKVLVNLLVEIAPELQGRNVLLEIKAKNSVGESVQYVPIYVVPPAP